MSSASKIQGFLHLDEGWFYGSGRRPSQISVKRAVLYDTLLRSLGLPLTDAFPGVDGEVMITAYQDSHYIEITVQANGKNCLVHEIDREENIYRENISDYELGNLLVDIVSNMEMNSWPSSESLAPITIGTPTGTNSRILVSDTKKTPKAIKVSPALNGIALSQEAGANALTLKNITRRSAHSRQFSGSSTNQIFLPEAA